MRYPILYILLFVVLPCLSWAQDSPAFSPKYVYLRNIEIEGNQRTRRSVILREMSVSEDAYLLRDSLDALTEWNRRRVFNLSLFTEVTINTIHVSKDTVDWNISVVEQWYIIPEFTFKLADRNFNVWWVEQNRDFKRVNVGMTLRHKNFRGNLEQVNVTAQLGYTQRFGLEYYRPYIDKKQKHGLGASIFFARNGEKFYTTDSNKWEFARTRDKFILNEFDVAGKYIYRPGYATRHTVQLGYRSATVADTILLLNPDYYRNGSKDLRMMELVYRFDLNLVDNWNYPLTGFKTVFYGVSRLGWKGIKQQHIAQVEAAYFKHLGKRWYTAHILRGRVTFPEKQPYSYRYAMGIDEEYVRGYEYYVIDGSQYGIVRNTLKYELLNTYIRNIPIKYISSMPVRIYPKVYTDIGYAKNTFAGNSTLNNRILYSAGMGVDFVTAYDFKIRFEYTWNHLGEKGLFLHFKTE